MKIAKRKTALLACLAITAATAVSIREDYFPLAEGNSWTFRKMYTVGREITRAVAPEHFTTWEVVGTTDSTYEVTAIEHGGIELLSWKHQVKSEDNGMISGFLFEKGALRHTYYEGDYVTVDNQLRNFYHIDTLHSFGYQGNYRNLWAVDLVGEISNFSSNTIALDAGLGPVGYNMDLNAGYDSSDTNTYTVTSAIQLSDVIIKEVPRVVNLTSALLFAPSDSLFDHRENFCLTYHDDLEKWTEECRTGIEISFPFSYGLSDNHVITSSYSELNNTLRVWIADSAAMPMDCGPEMDCISLPPEPRGGNLHTLSIDRLGSLAKMNVKIYYEETLMRGSTRNPDLIFDEEVILDSGVSLSKVAFNSSERTLFSITGKSIEFSGIMERTAGVTVHDMRGRVVAQMNAMGKRSISLDQLSKGVYLISVKANGFIQSKKVKLQ